MDRTRLPPSILRLSDRDRRELDADRLRELTALLSSDQFLSSLAGNEVLGLFPVALEAKLDAGRLRLRIWPDAIATPTHDPRFSEKELAATQRYWREEAAVGNDEAARANWRLLCEELGSTRAAWAAQALRPTNVDLLAPGVEPVFPDAPMQDDESPFVPRAMLLPDRWVAIGIRDQATVFEHFGAPIPLDLAVGLDTTPAEAAGLANREGEPIQLPPRMRWMTDFALAVRAGMAMEIRLAAGIDRLDELIVFGLRLTQTTAQNAASLADLFAAHRYSRGLAFVPQGTPTNNSAVGGSGLPSRSERIDAAFDLERRPRSFGSGSNANGVAAAQAFGIDSDTLARLPDSGASDPAAEPDGFEPEAAAAMQTALWQVTIGAALEDFLLLPAARSEALRDFACRHLRAAGPVPAIRVGRQPYGVLPVSSLADFIAMPAEGIDAQLLPLLRAARSWFAMLRGDPLYDGSVESALRQLGRSMSLYAETTVQNPGKVGENRWAALAGTLARSTRNTIRDTWRTAAIRATVEAEPLPVARAVVDEATVGELQALAGAAPAALLASPLPGSVLGRIMRQAALLEWSRFARVAIEACVDAQSRSQLAQRAAQAGSDVYIVLLIEAFAPVRPDLGAVAPPIGTSRIERAQPRPEVGGAVPGRPDRPEPPRPPPPPRPPRPPAGEPEVTAAERQRIAALVGNLAQPLASCPGAARLASFRAALSQLARFPAARLEAELFGVLDLCNHRLDAWFTSIASRRLATVRSAKPQGLVIGGWGLLQDVRPVLPADPQQQAEYIHAPSLDQAAAAAVLRSGARRANQGGSRHADIDLSSRRVRLARWILEGIRNGRSLNELLGARFERAVKGTPAEARLGALRTAFTASDRRGVLDGLALQRGGGAADPALPDVLDEALDAVADALTAEAVYQIVRGDPVGGLLGLDELAAGQPPPRLRVTETPAAGIRLTHRIVVALPEGSTAPGWPRNATPRSRAEPLIDAWCGLMLGPGTEMVLAVDGEEGGPAAVALSSLGVGAIDVVLAGRSGDLAEFVARAAAALDPQLVGPRVRQDRRWQDLVGLCDAIGRVLAQGEVLRGESFDVPSLMPDAAAEDSGDLPQRVQQATADLQSLRDALAAGADRRTAAGAALFGIRLPVDGSPEERRQALLAAIDSRLAATASGTPRERLQAVFGGDLPGLTSFVPRDPEVLATATQPPPPSLLGDDPLAPSAWLEAVGRIHPNAAALAEALLRKEIVEGSAATPLRIAQAPWVDGDRWIATSFGDGDRRPAGRLSVLLHAPAGFDATRPLGGLLVDAWTDTVPVARRDTAMALRFNNASTRAPQVILLAVSPDPSKPWTTGTLLGILRETLVLTRLRMQPATTFSRGGLMPSVWLGQRPGGTGISFTP